MEEKKKVDAMTPEGARHSKFSKKKGYFIEPARANPPKDNKGENTPKKPYPPKASSNTAPKEEEKLKSYEKNGNGGKNRRRKGNGKQDRTVTTKGTNEAPGKNPPVKDGKKQGEQDRRHGQSGHTEKKRHTETMLAEKGESNTAGHSSRHRRRSDNRDKNHVTSPSNGSDTPRLRESLSDIDTKQPGEFRPFPEDAPVEEVHYDISEISSSIYDDSLIPPKPEEDEGERVEVVGIRFKSTGKVYYFSPGEMKIPRGSFVIVETARGQEYGEVDSGNHLVKESEIVPPLRPILRMATAADTEHNRQNHEKEEEAFRICNEKILDHKLDMKLIDAQYTFDNSKLLFYFTSSGRVDFRDLVKDLASYFHTRIELRQIGIRDEAKLIGGLGMCGRSLCCSLFLTDFGQVSIKMAKEQNLSLNSAKISGICGRLMCCLRYEHEAYDYEIKNTPPVDSLVKTADGNGIVTEINPLQRTVKVRLIASPDIPPKVYSRDDVVLLQKKAGTQKGNGKENKEIRDTKESKDGKNDNNNDTNNSQSKKQ